MRIPSLVVLLSFINVQLFALIVGLLFIVKQTIEPIVENPDSVDNSFFFFGYIVVSALVMLVVLKFYKGKRLFQILELLLLFVTANIFFSLLFDENVFSFAFVVFSLRFDVSLALVAGLLAVAIRLKFENQKNLLLIFSTAVIGAFLGFSLDILPAAVLAALLSAYDFAAVFMTKHMVALAEGLRDRGASFSISFPAGSEKKKTTSIPISAKKGGGAKVTKTVTTYGKAEIVELGTGDLVIPAMLIVAALKLSIAHALITLIGASIGIFALFYYIDKKKGYWPALPPIVGGALLFLIIYSYLPFKFG